MRRLLPLLFVLCPLAPAIASAPDAWDAHYRLVVDRCLAASKLDKPRPDGHLMLFSDEVGTALLVRGKAKKKDVRMLCIFRRGSETVEIQPVDDGVDPSKLRR
jgi:hypothetical protein